MPGRFTLLSKFVDDRLLTVGLVPTSQKRLKCRITVLNTLARVISKALGDQLAVRAQVLDALRNKLDRDVIDNVLRGPARRTRWVDGNGVGRSWRVTWFGRRIDWICRSRLVDDHGCTVKFRIGEQFSRSAEVHDREVELPVLLVDSGTTPDYLLELRHRTDRLIQHDQLARLSVDSRRHQLTGRGDYGVPRLGGDEVVEFGLTFCIVTSDLHDVLAVLGNKISVLVRQSRTHPLSVIDVFTEDDRLGVTIARLREVLGDLLRNELRPLFQHKTAIEVGLVVDPIFDHFTVLVGFAVFGTPPDQVFVDVDPHDLVWRQVAVVDSPLERVSEDRLTEVGDV